ncbi:MAG: tetratricopeptide repeat protein [Steroidobacteraceae bacterium]
MTRTTRYKIQYAVVLVVGVALAAALSWWLRYQVVTLLVIAGILLIPGRVSGFIWRDFYRSRRLHDLGQYEASLKSSQRFVNHLAERPHLRRYWWLAWAVYSRDPLAMALNNIGSTQLELGMLEEAEASFREALKCDPEYPIPHFNLAVLCMVRNDRLKAEEHANNAVELGYYRNAADRMLHAASRLLARIEGRGHGLRADA